MTIYRVIVSTGTGPLSGTVEEETFTGRARAWLWAARKWVAGWHVVAIYPLRKR